MVSSEAEHQTLNLAVTGSTPVPQRLNRGESVTKKPAGAGDRRSAAGIVLVRRESVVTCHRPAATQDGALQCADTACASPWQRQTDADGSARAMLKQRPRLSQINALDSTGSSALRIRMWDRRFASPPTAFYCELTRQLERPIRSCTLRGGNDNEHLHHQDNQDPQLRNGSVLPRRRVQGLARRRSPLVRGPAGQGQG